MTIVVIMRQKMGSALYRSQHRNANVAGFNACRDTCCAPNKIDMPHVKPQMTVGRKTIPEACMGRSNRDFVASA